MAEWLEHTVTMWQRWTKTFAYLGNLYSIHNTKPGTTQQHSLQTVYMLELDLGSFPTDAAHFLPNDQYLYLSYMSEKKFPTASYTWSPL